MSHLHTDLFLNPLNFELFLNLWRVSFCKFPAIRRDLALVVNKDVLAVALENAVQNAAAPQVIAWNIFDVYTGKGIADEQKSVALSLTLQDATRTLEDAEVNGMVDAIVASLQEAVGAVLR